MKEKPDILLADDDRLMRKAFGALLESEGFSVRAARNGEEAVAAFAERRPDMVVLDMMMPKMNGLETCKAIRERDASVPILFLSCLADDTKKLRAYDSGADDYVEKTTNGDVIVAKIRAVLRRVAEASCAAEERDRLRLGRVEVDLKSHEVFFSGELANRLTKTECDILKILSSRRGQTFPRDELIAGLRGEGFVCEDALLYVHVSNLRKKLGVAAEMLTSVRDVGYSLLF